MCRNGMFLVFSIFALAWAPGSLWAQGGPGPRPFGPRGFGGRVLGVEGCVNDGWRVPSGTPGYAAQITRSRTEAVLNGSPVTHTATELAYRDNSGVTYQQITLPAFGNSGTPRTVICIYDPNLRVRLVVNPANMTAREFQLPNRTKPNNSTSSNNSNSRPPRPQNPNVVVTHPTPPAALSSEISTYCSDATDTKIVRGSGQNAFSDERVFCPSLRLELYSQFSDSHGISTTTATITATNTGVNLATLAVPYPLVGYNVTVVTPGSRGNRVFNGGNGGSTQSTQP